MSGFIEGEGRNQATSPLAFQRLCFLRFISTSNRVKISNSKCPINYRGNPFRPFNLLSALPDRVTIGQKDCLTPSPWLH
mgnify:CR=1 FL=1